MVHIFKYCMYFKMFMYFELFMYFRMFMYFKMFMYFEMFIAMGCLLWSSDIYCSYMVCSFLYMVRHPMFWCCSSTVIKSSLCTETT